jgi:SAM-dependent methyltransferase
MGHKKVLDTWKRGDPYEQYMGRWSRQLAPRFLSWLAIPAGRRWLDLGCGTGALSASILEHRLPSSLVGVDPSEGFLQRARERLGEGSALHRGSATEIPLDNASVDVTVSGLVLNFVPDCRQGLTEMARVTVSGGTVGAYVWDYREKMELIRNFWDAAVELDPTATALDEAKRFPICRPESLAKLFASCALREIEVTAIQIRTRFADFEDYRQPFLGGQGPAPAYAMALDDTERARLRDRIRAKIPLQADGSISLSAGAWAVRGTLALKIFFQPFVEGSHLLSCRCFSLAKRRCSEDKQLTNIRQLRRQCGPEVFRWVAAGSPLSCYRADVSS